MGKKGYLTLEDGKIFEGDSFGSESDVAGEVVFNTGMVGYPEGFTDPSYYGQILTMTYPLIGNYGVPQMKVPKESEVPKVPKAQNKNNIINPYFESDKVHIRGLIVSSYIESTNHWQATQSLSSWLLKQNVPALSGIDTRSLTKIIREKGVMKASISFESPRNTSGTFFYDINRENLVASVSTKKTIRYGKGKWKILLLDCGVKLNQIRMLLKLNCEVIRVPWDFDPFSGGNSATLDAIVISNGPGDPKMTVKTINVVKKALERKIPILGICLGNQILALAAGADTYKLKYGHRGQNQPVVDNTTGKCYVTTQNHGFTVDTKTLPGGWQSTFTNLNDSTNEGIKHNKLPFYSVQFHPESTPGPTDTGWIFDYFIFQVKDWLKKN